MRLNNDPEVLKLVRDLHLPRRGDALRRIRDFAIDRVGRTLADSPVPVEDLDTLRAVVANKFGVRLEFLTEDSDVLRVGERYGDFHRLLPHRLQEEFVRGNTEGITLQREDWDRIQFRYLAVVDARGRRTSRAFFTAWHEITHLIVHPEQLQFPGFRRTPNDEEIHKDPIESVVDYVAARIGFYPPLFAPILKDAVRSAGGFSFHALDLARQAATPNPSLLSTALAGIRFTSEPTVFLTADLACKAAEARALRSPQQTFDFARVEPEFDLRAVSLATNEAARKSRLAIHRNIRIPRNSVISQAFESSEDQDFCQLENQDWWATSKNGALPELRLHVQATRRGRFVYGLLQQARP